MDRPRDLGPGWIVTAAFIGPGTVTTASVAGASFGHAPLWAIAGRLRDGQRHGRGICAAGASGMPYPLEQMGDPMALMARDLMIRDVGVVDAGADLETLERSFAEAGVSGFPVVEGGTVVGVVSRADVLRKLGGGSAVSPRLSLFYADLGAFEAEEVLETFASAAARGSKRLQDLRVDDLATREIVAVRPDTPVRDVARTLAEHGVHRALVIDAGTLVGIVSSLDIVRLVGEGKLAKG